MEDERMAEDGSLRSRWLERRAGMRKTAWGNLEEITRSIDFIADRQYPANMELATQKISEHLLGVFKSPSYPKPITDAIMDQAVEYARGKFEGPHKTLIVDPRES